MKLILEMSDEDKGVAELKTEGLTDEQIKEGLWISYLALKHYQEDYAKLH